MPRSSASLHPRRSRRAHALARLLSCAALACLLARATAAPRAGFGVAGLTHAERFPRGALPASSRARHARVMASWRTVLPASAAAPNRSSLTPTDFGADPTCSVDSSAAFDALLAVLLARPVGNLSDGIRDLGGAVVDLAGGCYLLSRPFAIPQFYGNLHIAGGELRAAPTFSSPAGAALLQIGAAACSTPSGQGSCNENVGVHGVTLDGAHVAGTCLAIEATMGATLDMSSAVFGFNKVGILLQGGHESMITETWVAAYFWSSPMKEKNDAVGILINGNDMFTDNVIVFSARDGVVVNGAANIIVDTHTWNCATGNGGRGIVNGVSQNRFSGVYLDYTDMVVVGNGAQQLVLSSSYFLGGATLVFHATPGHTAVDGVSLNGNAWAYSGGSPYVVNETEAVWTSVTDLTISGTSTWGGAPLLAPTASAVVALAGAATAVDVDFSAYLLFPSVPIAAASIAVQLLGAGAAVPTIARIGAAPGNQTVTVALPAGTAADGYSLRVSVDQSTHSTTH